MGLTTSGQSNSSNSFFDPLPPRTTAPAQRDDATPRGYRKDEDGFLHRVPRPAPPLGRKKGTGLAAVPYSPPKARIFLSRVRPTISVDQIREFVHGIAGADADVERIQTRNANYSAFLIKVEKRVEDRVLDPDEWEEGLIIRPFRGFLRQAYDERHHETSHSNGRDDPADVSTSASDPTVPPTVVTAAAVIATTATTAAVAASDTQATIAGNQREHQNVATI